MPKIEEMVNKIAQYKVFSTIDLRSAYYQIPLSGKDKIYTAFEADGKLWQFTRMPFGVTNRSAVFQWKMDTLVVDHELDDTFPFVGYITICGCDDDEHDENLKLFMEAAEKERLAFIEAKCVFRVNTIDLLGYRVSHNSIKPDPDRLAPLLNLPVPEGPKSLKRVIGMFSYYVKWINHFSDKIHILNNVSKFLLNETQKNTFEDLKLELANAAMQPIDENIPFVEDTDASDFAISATRNQDGRPVAFHSRTLQASEQHQAPVEKEARVIVEAIDHWRHFFLGRHFILITDQKSVSYMYNYKSSSKIKNDKIMRWRVALSPYPYDIQFRPGKHNHFIKTKNLPYSLDNIKHVWKECKICQEVKPRYYNPNKLKLVKATHPFQRLSIDFKGPLPSKVHPFLLTIIDEYSRFPFAYPVKDVSTSTVIKRLGNLFSIFGMPGYVHSDRGPSIMSEELKRWLFEKGIPSSRTTPYNPQGNGQVEGYNGIIWKSVLLALKSRNLPITEWERVLLDALH